MTSTASPRQSIVDLLHERDLCESATAGLVERTQRGPITLYCGFDPTADSLHVGNLVPIMALRGAQKAGHRPIAVAGGGTGMVGDPSGKSDERKLLDEGTLALNVAFIKKQLEALLDFSPGPVQAKLVDNMDWLCELSFIEVLRDIGKHFSVTAMMRKDSVKNRLDREGGGISYTEFSYMVLQAYDFWHLFKHHDCELQIGGSDQMGNIVEGIELIRRKEAKNAYGLTVPLVTRADGQKFGKTETGTVWLSPHRTPVFEFSQYFVRTDDRDVVTFLKFFTELPKTTIDDLAIQVRSAPEKREAQKTLAFEVTKLVHGERAAQEARAQAEALYQKEREPREMTRREFEVFAADIPPVVCPLAHLAGEGWLVLDMLMHCGLTKGKNESRREIQGGAIRIGEVRIEDPQACLRTRDLMHARYVLVAKGKKHRRLLVFE